MAYRFYIDERALLRMNWVDDTPTGNADTLVKDGSWRPNGVPSYRAGEIDRQVAQERAQRITGNSDEVDLDAPVRGKP